MLSSSRPWFFAESLRAQFSQDILEALAAERIDAQQSQWLESLFFESDSATAKPRVDQLLYEDVAPKHAELSGALLISDGTGMTAAVYLSTALYGLERFDNRAQLITELTRRFALNAGDVAQLEFQRLEDELFEPLTRAIIDQQVRQLERLTERFRQVPELREALGQTLQEKVDTQVPGTTISVFTHLAQIQQLDSASQTGATLGTQTLVEMAMSAFANQPLPAGLRHQWLDSEGREMTEDQARPWSSLMASVAGGLTTVYERLLRNDWGALAGDGMTLRDLACQAFTECFRQHMLQSRHEATLSTLEFCALRSLFLPGDGWAGELQVSRLSVQIGNQEPVKLAGICLIGFTSGQLPDLLLYSAEKGLQRFTSRDAVAEHLAGIDERVQLFSHTSANDHPLLRTHGALHLRFDPVEKSPLGNLADSVIGLQKRNLADVLKGTFNSCAQAAVAVQDALDIRSLLDPRLSAVSRTAHWNDALAGSERSWSAFSSPARMAELSIPFSKNDDDAATLPWANYLRDARSRVDTLFQAQPHLAGCARTVLNRYFSVLQGGAVDARHLWFRGDDDSVVSLPVLLMEQVSGHRAATVPPDCEVYFDADDSAYTQYLSWLTPELLDHVMSRAQQDFAEEYSRQILAFHSERLLAIASGIIPAKACGLIREGLLRLELNMQRTSGKISDQGLAMLQQILDRPVFTLRESLGVKAVEVSIPAWVHDSSQPPVPLTNVLVLQQPLYSDSKPLLWSGVLGLQEFDSLDELQLQLNARLEYPGSRERWLQLAAVPDQDTLRGVLEQGNAQQLIINLLGVEGNFLERLESDELNRKCLGIDAAYRTALDWQVDAGLFEDMMAAMALDSRTRGLLDMLSGELETRLLVGGMPAWLRDASVADLLLFRQMLVRFRQLYSSRREIPTVSSLDEYAAEQLKQRLHKDFPATQLDPDVLSITLTRYTVAPSSLGEVPSSIPAATTVISESLTHYAINRFSRFQDASLSISSDEAFALPGALDAAYIRELVRTLDIAAGYEQYLKQIFSEAAADYAERREQFIVQAPCALLLSALSLKLQGLLTSNAYAYIESVFNMPDGVARLSVNGQRLEFSPLKLVCAEGYAADRVTGVFLIRPADQAQGPWILHATADADFLFKEYAGQSEFMAALYTSEKLQAMLLERLDPTVRFVYEHDGFIQPHLSWATGGFTELSGARPGPVQVSFEPVQENALDWVFRASYEVMVLVARKHSVTTAQDDSAGSHFLLLQGGANALMFLPGRLGGLVGLWQGKDLLHASLESASEDHWGKATAEFTTALALLIASALQMEEQAAWQSPPPGDISDETVPRWHDPQLQVDLSARLQQFEVHDVALSTLQRDQTLSIFSSSVSLKQYVALYGKVYQVKRRDDGWRVIDGDKDGPRIRLDADECWVLDTELGSRRDGGALTKLRSTHTDLNVDDIFLVEARGMPEVQRLYPRKAAQIVEAHAKARQYLENALDNLTIVKPQVALDPRVARIITDFFGVKLLSNVSVVPIKKAFFQIYRELLDPTFSPCSSERYVVGSNKLGYEDSTAFNFAQDPLHRVFLSERYFVAPHVRLRPRLIRQGSFNADTHFRASILIHELSHIASGTHDIAYVDSTAPYLDLLEDTGAYRARLKLEQQKAQHGLSHRTPRDELFRMEDGGLWRDLKTADSDAKQAILKITDTDNLETARDLFLYDTKIRSELILSNADSVTLLATLLGRERFLPVVDISPGNASTL